MNAKKILTTLLTTLIISNTFSMAASDLPEGSKAKSDQISSNSSWDDFVKSLNIAFDASYLQFSRPASWILLAIGLSGLSYIMPRDSENSEEMVKKGPSTLERRLSNDWGTLTNAPAIPIATYITSRMIDDSKLREFSIEYLATLALINSEALLLSFIPIHERPSKQELSPWESKFRSESSFPSGHVLGVATLTFKTIQYYGPVAAILPGAATYIIGAERVKSGKHYLSDVFAGIVLSALASEGTKIANEKNTHKGPVYRWIYEHEFGFLAFPGEKEQFFALKFSY